jgi:hypothetical protein
MKIDFPQIPPKNDQIAQKLTNNQIRARNFFVVLLPPSLFASPSQPITYFQPPMWFFRKSSFRLFRNNSFSKTSWGNIPTTNSISHLRAPSPAKLKTFLFYYLRVPKTVTATPYFPTP